MPTEKQLRANRIALKAHPVARKCEIKGCRRIGHRHHDDYDQPDKIRWLCAKHHHQFHHGIDFDRDAEIRASRGSDTELAARYSLSRQRIHQIREGSKVVRLVRRPAEGVVEFLARIGMSAEQYEQSHTL